MRRDLEWNELGGEAWVVDAIARDPDLSEIGPLIALERAVLEAAAAFEAALAGVSLDRRRISALLAITLLQRASRSCRAFSEARGSAFRFDRLAAAAEEMDAELDLSRAGEHLLDDELELCRAEADSRLTYLITHSTS